MDPELDPADYVHTKFIPGRKDLTYSSRWTGLRT